MPKKLTQYRVFIGSPSELEKERKLFLETLERYTKVNAEPRSVIFFPVGWEDTLPGRGRPQEIINKELSDCDYAVFVLHDHWGSPTGSGNTSGTEEEWQLAERLYDEKQIRNIALFFKNVRPAQLKDAGPQLRSVLAFKDGIKNRKTYLFKPYAAAPEFAKLLEALLAEWLIAHERTANSSSTDGLLTTSPTFTGVAATPTAFPLAPGFEYWIAEADKCQEADPPNYGNVLFCATKALEAATSDIEMARGYHSLGTAHFHLNNMNSAIAAFAAIIDRFASASGVDERVWRSLALVNKAVVLRQLGRSEEEIAVYNEVINQFGTAADLILREHVARALVGKALTLGQSGPNEEQVAVYDDLVRRFEGAPEMSMRKQVAQALILKALKLDELGRIAEELEVFDDIVRRFETSTDVSLREEVAHALVLKGLKLGILERSAEEISVYDEILRRFGSAPELSLKEQVAEALDSKGGTLAELGRNEEEIAVYDDLVLRFGRAKDLSLRTHVAKALFNRAITLAKLGRSEEEIAAYDDIILRFGVAVELPLREHVARALFNKGKTLGELGRHKEARSAYDELIGRFASASDPSLQETVARAISAIKASKPRNRKTQKK